MRISDNEGKYLRFGQLHLNSKPDSLPDATIFAEMQRLLFIYAH
jgi:hypothetical protein